MASPTMDDVHIPAAGGKKKAVAAGKVPPQFLPKQKGKVAKMKSQGAAKKK